MVKIEQLEQKWQLWLLDDLLAQFKVLMKNLAVYRAFEITCPFDESKGDEIASWIILNYFESACVAVRRLGDKDRNTRSLRAFLEEMRLHPYAFPRLSRIARDPSFSPSARSPSEVEEYFVKRIDEDIRLIEDFTRPIKDHSDKYLAHVDKDRRKITDAGFDDLEKAILKYHLVFRFWAYIIAGFSFDRTTFDHFELSQIDQAKVRGEFKLMWDSLL